MLAPLHGLVLECIQVHVSKVRTPCHNTPSHQACA